MLDMSQPLVFTVEGVMSPEECAQTVARIEALGPSAAPITTSRGFVHAPKIRNNSRVMFDDVALAASDPGRRAFYEAAPSSSSTDAAQASSRRCMFWSILSR